jgi:xylulokinase
METAEAGRRGLSVYQVLDELAEKVPPGSHGLLLLPHFAGALSPDLNHSARGVLFGLGLQTRKAHLIRAALESVGYLLRENVELFEQLGVSATEIYSVGGGAASPLWNSIKADIIGRPVVVTTQEECASLGAAMLGSVAAGWYKNVEDAWAQLAQGKRAFLPNPAHQPVYERGYRHYQKLYSCLKDFFVEVQA